MTVVYCEYTASKRLQLQLIILCNGHECMHFVIAVCY